jgi:hypothetical protein
MSSVINRLAREINDRLKRNFGMDVYESSKFQLK